MNLTRRDVLGALAAVGLGSDAGCSASLSPPTDSPVGDHEVETLVALGEVVYPSDVEGVPRFVRAYSAERVRADATYGEGVVRAVADLDDYVREWHDDPFATLSPDGRVETLDYMTVDTADPDPEGTASQRVRYYLVNELLYAFYSTPTGARLAGLENPPGYPGGTRSYQRGPNP